MDSSQNYRDARPGSRLVPVEHQLAVHEIEPSPDEALAPLTLMELVDAVSEVSETEQEVLATVTYMLRSGRIQLADDEDAAALTALTA